MNWIISGLLVIAALGITYSLIYYRLYRWKLREIEGLHNLCKSYEDDEENHLEVISVLEDEGAELRKTIQELGYKMEQARKVLDP